MIPYTKPELPESAHYGESGWSLLLTVFTDLTKALLVDPAFLLLGVLLGYSFVIAPPIMITLFSVLIYDTFTDDKIAKLNHKFALKVND